MEPISAKFISRPGTFLVKVNDKGNENEINLIFHFKEDYSVTGYQLGSDEVQQFNPEHWTAALFFTRKAHQNWRGNGAKDFVFKKRNNQFECHYPEGESTHKVITYEVVKKMDNLILELEQNKFQSPVTRQKINALNDLAEYTFATYRKHNCR